jgi:pimeloyl-ACP methyl ester carboxylesterase
MSSVRYELQATGFGSVELWQTAEADHGLLLLHACGTGAKPLHRLAEALSGADQNDCQVVIPNLTGYGGSQHKQRDLAALEQHLAIIGYLLNRTANRRWHVAGHSMGGLLALQTALIWPQKVISVNAIEPMAFGVLDPADANDAAALTADRQIIASFRQALQAGQPQRGLAAFIGYWNETPWLQLPDFMRAVLIGLSPQMLAEATAISYDPTTAAAYRELDRPVQLLAGANTRFPAQRIIERLQHSLPQVQTQTINGAGHMGPLTHPAEFAQTIRSFIQKLC